MKLKHVELYGFKSFAEKTKLTFNKDISAVVGPNGSGKSNIADAIRWVLGEQSAKSLRGSNMQDVIFAGSESKKQMNMAQVSLVLDNSDKSLPIAFEEVNVTRRVFRTGESEYLLNKAKVKLKDIRELFLDTGIGKDGYSLIGQGRIDEILSGKPEERREIFEEASGISKNKYKKTEAERRLVRNEENLEKLSSEIRIKKQEFDILEKQSNNAKEGMKLTSQLEVLELNLLKKAISKAGVDLENDKSRLEYISKDLQDKTSRLDKLTSVTAPIQDEIKELEERLSHLRDKTINRDKKLQENISEINLISQKVDFYKNDIERFEKSVENNSSKIIELEKDILVKKQEFESLNQEKVKLAKEIDANKDNLAKLDQDLLDLSKEYSNVSQSIKDLNLQHSNLRVDINTKEKLDSSNKEMLENYRAQIAQLDQKTAEADENREDITSNISFISDQINNLRGFETQLKKEIEKFEIQIKESSEKLADYRNHYLRLESERNILYRQYKSYDGYYKSVQNLLKLSDKDQEVKNKIIGVLADLLETEDKYTEALDVAMGSALQNIVIDNEEDGKFLIDLIKKKNIGRITFLPISKIKGTSNDVSHKLVIDNLNNLVKFDKKIESVVNYYLSRTLLVKDMNDAIKVSRDLKGYRIITLEGEVINSWGSMVGGKTFKRDNNSLLNRKKEIDGLAKELKSIQDQANLAKNNMESLSATKMNLENDLSENNKAFNNLDIELRNLNNNLREIDIENEYVVSRKNEIIQAISKLEEEIKISSPISLEEIEGQISENSKIETDLLEKIEALKLKMQEIDKEGLLLQSKLQVSDRDLQVLSNAIDNNQVDLDNLENTKTNDTKSIDLTNQLINESEARLEKLKANIESLKNDTDSSQDNIQDLSKTISDKKEKIELDRLEIEALRQEISEDEKEKFRLDLKLENAVQKIQDLRTDYMDTYSIDEELLDSKLDKVEFAEGTKREVNQIKSRLSEIGYFNFETIEQFNTISEELDFMNQQFSDLTKSRDDIILLIKNIEKEMKENFVIAFEQIRERFNSIFQILFDGGEADIRLDSDDILTAGVDIIAKPKGKKLKSIALLSGGERAMTAVALLFAIFEINPAPFCVLDEIDAALDEANIKRYINYLKSLVDQTQFIIITHRKATMEMAEILYGVTMEEQGISKIITLALDSYN